MQRCTLIATAQIDAKLVSGCAHEAMYVTQVRTARMAGCRNGGHHATCGRDSHKSGVQAIIGHHGACLQQLQC